MKEYIIIKSVNAEQLDDGVGTIKVDNGNGICSFYSHDEWAKIAHEAHTDELATSALDMVSESFEDRFRAEYKQLSVRIRKLDNMLAKWRDGQLDFTPRCNYGLFELQLEHMRTYKTILKARAKIENIEL